MKIENFKKNYETEAFFGICVKNGKSSFFKNPQFSIKDLIYPEKISNTFLQRSMVKSLVNLTFDNKFPNNVLGRCKETHLIFHCNVQQWQQLPSTFSFYWFFCQSTQREAFEIFNVSNYLSFSRGNLVFSGFKFLCEIELVSSE